MLSRLPLRILTHPSLRNAAYKQYRAMSIFNTSRLVGKTGAWGPRLWGLKAHNFP